MDARDQQGDGDHESVSVDSLSDGVESDVFYSAPPKLSYRRLKMNSGFEAEDQLGGNLLREIKSSPAQRRLDEVVKRTRSLAGPSPVCHFGPKAQLFHSEKDVTCIINDPGTTRLKWSSTPQSVLVVKKIRDVDVLGPFVQLLGYLLKKCMTVFVEKSVLSEEHLLNITEFASMKNQLCTFVEGCDELNDKIDIIICLGGDGTLLYASSLFQASVPPVMAFHLGSFGFLTPFDFASFEKRIESVLRGHANLTLRSRLQAVIAKKTNHRSTQHQLLNGSSVDSLSISSTDSYSPEPDNADEDPDPSFVVLNDVVIDRGPSPYLVNIDLFVDGRLITSVQGDGLIISTPTGSTAYAVAAGASIIHPGVPAIMITPICPHSLSFRPIMVPAGCILGVRVSEDARDPAWVSFDGRSRQELGYGDILRVTTSVYPLPSICQSDQMQDWFAGLSNCFHWNARKLQKPFNGGSGHDKFNGES